MADPLDKFEARADLTDRECCKIIGGLLGSLNLMVDNPGVLRNAVRWWADQDIVIHATSAARRSRFAKDIWALRRKHGTDKRTGALPF